MLNFRVFLRFCWAKVQVKNWSLRSSGNDDDVAWQAVCFWFASCGFRAAIKRSGHGLRCRGCPLGVTGRLSVVELLSTTINRTTVKP